MQFFLKIFKALNSAQRPYQVTLAIVLGMIAGLTPMAGAQTAVILLLAFVLNIHLGLFFAAAAFFAGVGYLFDPWFEQLGYAILSAEGLRGLWTSWYNSGFIRLSHFNNTLVMGSTVVALALAFPLYALLGWVIGRYRDVLSTVLERYPKLGLMGFLKATQNRDPLLRWWGAGIFAGVAGLVAVVLLVLIDPAAKWAIESGGSALLDRDVRVGSVDVSLAGGSVTIDRIEIAGETQGIDAFSADRAAFDVALGALLMNRVHIEEIAVTGMGFGTPATLKKAPAPAAEPETAASKSSEMALPSFELPTPESILKNADLASVKLYEDGRKEIDAIVSKWQKVADEQFTGKELEAYKQEFESLQKLSKSKDPQQLLALTGKVQAFNDKIKKAQSALGSLQSEFDADQKRIAALYARLEKAPLEDYEKLKSAYTLDGSGAMNVISLLMGDTIRGYLDTARRYYAMVEPYLQSEPEPPVPPRGKGRWMKYPLTVPSPDLWIAKTAVGGVLQQQGFEATISDITDNQKALGRPLRFQLSSDGAKIKALKLTGEDNRLGAQAVDTLAFSARALPLEAMAFDPVTVSKSSLAFGGDLKLVDAEGLTGKANLALSDAAMSMKGDDTVAKIVGDVLGSISAFKADVAVKGTLDNPDVSVGTDLDKQLSKALSKGLAKQAEAYQGELKQMLQAQMGDQLGSLKQNGSSLVDIDGLIAQQGKDLGGLGSDAGALLGKGGSGGAIKGLLPF